MARNRVLFFVVIFLIVFIIFLNFSSALNANFSVIAPSNSLVERAATNLINFSVGSMNTNISRVDITITGSTNGDPDSFVVSTNGTSSSNTNFSNSTYSTNLSDPSMGRSLILNFSNTTSSGFINNQTTQNFWFNVTGKSQVFSLVNVLINVTAVDGTYNSTTVTFGVSFRFSGYVKNETGDFQNGTNVTLYRFTEGQNGPPVETPVASALADTSGFFTLSGMNSSGALSYVLKMIYYNSSSVATKVGSILPPFPAVMFYPQSFSGAYEFMKPPSLNGTTFYLGPASTINITAQNGSVGNASQLFGYMVMDKKTGLPIVSNAMGNVSSVQIVVPSGRNYTVMAVRANSQFNQFNSSICNGSFMNNTACFVPPKSNASINPTSEGQGVDVNFDLSVSRLYLYGCINLTGNSTVITNVTSILPRMLPWEGFVPPMRADTQDINLSSTLQLNISDPRCLGALAFYNISVLNSNYLVEFYATNTTGGAGAEWLAAFQNVSLTGQSAGANVQQNLTLRKLAGSYVAGGDINTSKITINLQNSSGSAVTQDKPHIDVHITHSSFGELTYIIESFSNGSFSIPLLNDSVVKLKIFSNNAPPKEKTLNLSQAVNNITLVTMSSGNSGFKRINSSGGIEDMNITNSSWAVNMRFLKSSSTCDVINTPSNCSLTNTNVKDFNPFTALVAGKINMEMKLTSSNVTLTFYNFDMFSAKQPPMESVMNDQASSGASSANQVWQFGSFVPADVYDYAVLGIPYSDSVIDDSGNVNMSIPVLYDENWNTAWNLSSGNTTGNLTTTIDEYLGNSNNRSFNSSGYRSFLSSTGITCNKTDSNITGASPDVYCFVNTSSNMIYVRVPHFSGVAPNIIGTSVTSSSSSSSSSGGGGVTIGGATTIITEKQFIEGYTKQLAARDKIKFNVSKETHLLEVTNISSSSTTITVTSTPQTATLNIGETKKFDLNGDSVYDLAVTLNRVVLFGNSTYRADITIKADSSSSASTTGSGSATTGNAVNNQGSNNATGGQTQPSSKKSLWLVWTVIGILVAVVAFFIFRRAKLKQRYMEFGF
ncbi:hypothetical protein HY212_03370 [Candidatus Pacearchaeota archaeon]|nr:hypothetical protein [Candidatus Pacearchaeota archaeon]